MKKLTVKALKRIRNGIIAFGMIASFLLWLDMPAIFRNTSMFHVGNGLYGHKLGALLCVFFPLLTFLATFLSRFSKPEFHAEGDEEYQKAEAERIERDELNIEVVTAGLLSAVAIVCMLVTLNMK